jgi:hypothetical protein
MKSLCLLALLGLAGIASADDWHPAAARDGLELAEAAARTWSEDSYLVYIENDEVVDATGLSGRWGYLFYSPTLHAWRAYSLGNGKIVSAGELEFGLEAPPLQPGWIDSGRAFLAAEDSAGREYREDHAGQLRVMLLIRGAFHVDKPDHSTWTLIYDSPSAPSLFVVVDAASGDVVRTWKG